MEGASVTGVMWLGFGLGLVHALDADHVMAVSLLSVRRASLRDSAGYAVRWAVGHGLALFALAIPALVLGIAIPASFSALAEGIVGAVLIGLGAVLLVDLARAHAHFHSHDGLLPHVHWHRHDAESSTGGHGDTTVRSAHDRQDHRHEHRAMLVGALHGWAGTAPFLALIPAVSQGSVRVAVLYLLVFCAGVLLAMLAFGGILGSLLASFLHQRLSGCLRIVRGATAAGSIAIGVHLLLSVW